MSPISSASEDWLEYRKLVLKSLEDLDERLHRLEDWKSDHEAEAARSDERVKGMFTGAAKDLKNEIEKLKKEIRNRRPLGGTKDGPNWKLIFLMGGAISGLIALAKGLVDLLSKTIGN